MVFTRTSKLGGGGTGTGTVTAVTAGYGIVCTPDPITGAGVVSLYVAPTGPTVALATSPAYGIYEVGDTTITSVDLTPTTTKHTNNITTLTLSRSGVGVIKTYATPNPAGATEATYTDASPVTTDTTYTASVGDGTLTGTSVRSFTFQNKMYYGLSTIDLLTTGANIMSSIATQHADFATSKAKTYSFAPTGADYVYIAYLASYGPISTSIFNSLPFTAYSYSDGSSFGHTTPTAITLTNSSGSTDNYYIVRTDNSYLSPATWQIG